MKLIPALALVALVLSGCGNWNRNYAPVATSSSYHLAGSGQSSGASADSNAGYNCPSSPNVLPDYDVNIDGTDRFTVCASASNNADILIHGSTSSSPTICVFPAQYVDQNHVYLKPDPKTGAAMYQCVEGSTSGAYATFASTNFNAVFIVESPNLQQMETCLAGGNYSFCPTYSYGRFR